MMWQAFNIMYEYAGLREKEGVREFANETSYVARGVFSLKMSFETFTLGLVSN